VLGQGAGRLLYIGEVGVALPQRGGHGDDGDVEAGEGLGLARGQIAAGRQSGGQGLGGDVLDIGLPRGQALDAGGLDVEADDVVTDLNGAHGEGQADIALPEDDKLGRRAAHGPHSC